jgi:hypothetical protein
VPRQDCRNRATLYDVLDPSHFFFDDRAFKEATLWQGQRCDERTPLSAFPRIVAMVGIEPGYYRSVKTASSFSET